MQQAVCLTRSRSLPDHPVPVRTHYSGVVLPRIVRVAGTAVAGALVDVWHANEKGRYSHFDPDQASYSLRPRIETDAQGRSASAASCLRATRFRRTAPSPSCSRRWAACNRPAYIHLLVVALGLRKLTTQINLPGDTFIDDDFAFATRDGLIVELEKSTPSAGYESLDVKAPFTRSRVNFVLQKALNDREAATEACLARALD